MSDDDAASAANVPDGIAHIGIAVRSLAETIPLYQDRLGLEVTEIIESTERGLRIAMIPCGDAMLELMEPMADDSQISRFLDRRGPGLHHLCLRVPDIDAKLRQLDADGVRLVSKTAEVGAEGLPVAFIHPKATGGVLLELLEETSE